MRRRRRPTARRHEVARCEAGPGGRARPSVPDPRSGRHDPVGESLRAGRTTIVEAADGA